MERFVGLDVGAETIKLAEVVRHGDSLRLVRQAIVSHGKQPGARLLEILPSWEWDSIRNVVATGRLGRQLTVERIPTKQALLFGYTFLHGDRPATVVNIGSRGFSVLEIRAAERADYRESSRCAQGTGNFLRQLVERFSLTVEEAAAIAEPVRQPALLSGRCPVILKTEMTHLANKGERQERILAGLLDAIAESAEVLVKPRRSPPNILLTGGVTRARRVREHFRSFAERNGMSLVDGDLEQNLVLEAVGCAVHAARTQPGTPALCELIRPAERTPIETLPALRSALGRVRRMARPEPPAADGSNVSHDMILGFDIGSTGSKLVALDVVAGEPVWEGYTRTSGDPVGAAQKLMSMFIEGPAGNCVVRGAGVTGSGREIVGSLMAICYGAGFVFVLNEIAAHARGAYHYDGRVDTIFEIGGQDAKYIRLMDGRVIDAAMNEACSAGTGSFIEEQGRQFEGVSDVAQLATIALDSDGSAALGQHCSIFMAQVIDEAVGANIPRERIVAGLYESVIQNYLNRVKGNRSVGDVIFCQGMPFTSDALAAAVARQTGAEVIVPPSPGSVGALGIALLAVGEIASTGTALDPRRFLRARVESKDAFVCKSVAGCGGSGNKCRIDCLTTQLEGDRRRFTWGGSCSLHDKGTPTRKLPDRAPQPFRERAELVAATARRLSDRRGFRRIALSDDFQLKGMFPFFATYLHSLGLDLDVVEHGDHAALKRGIEGSNVPWCAPMQQYHGVVDVLAGREADLVFAPMIREMPRVACERASQLCPIVQGSADLLRCDLGTRLGERMISPVIDIGPGLLDAPVFLDSCRRLAAEVGVRKERVWRAAFEVARAEQLAFDQRLLDAGRAALERCAAEGLVPVVVLGRTYTIHDDLLNSNVPSILRDQGAIAIPLDCYPVAPRTPVFPNMYWGHGQRILRAAWQIRRSPGVYALFTSNYSCGPDSFMHHFVQDQMNGKPFSIIETDGHAADAGTRTRVEAFLHCIRQHNEGRGAPPAAERLTVRAATLREIATSGERVLIPNMGDATRVVAAALRGMGVAAEALPEPESSALKLGRRHTSGKECLPMTLTLGSVLERLACERNGQRFALLMAGADGPCRFGVYKEMHQLVLERLGLSERVRIWSPPFGDYFQDVPPGLGTIIFAGSVAADLLRDMLHDVRARECRPGSADAAYEHHLGELTAIVESAASGDLSGRRVLRETATGRIWGIAELVGRAARDFASLRGAADLPLVLVVGEIYVRSVASSNGRAVEALERRGVRAKVASFSEFLQYSDYIGARLKNRTAKERLESWVRRRIEVVCHAAASALMGWHISPPVREIVDAAGPWFRDALEAETVLTVGGAVHAWRNGEIDGVLSLGPLECMPNKLAESQLVHIGEQHDLLSLTLSVNGDPIDRESLDSFAIELHARHRARRAAGL